MTPEQERIDAASHAPACPAVVDGIPCDRNLGHWGPHSPPLGLTGEAAAEAHRLSTMPLRRDYRERD